MMFNNDTSEKPDKKEPNKFFKFLSDLKNYFNFGPGFFFYANRHIIFKFFFRVLNIFYMFFLICFFITLFSNTYGLTTHLFNFFLFISSFFLLIHSIDKYRKIRDDYIKTHYYESTFLTFINFFAITGFLSSFLKFLTVFFINPAKKFKYFYNMGDTSLYNLCQEDSYFAKNCGGSFWFFKYKCFYPLDTLNLPSITMGKSLDVVYLVEIFYIPLLL